MRLYNTLGRQKEDFIPIKKGEVSFYHCGPTVYYTQQIGNLFAMVMADLVHRIFLYNNYKVTMARNYTDVGHLSGDNAGDADSGEDRMEKASRRDNKSPEEIADYYKKEFDAHTGSLNILVPTYRPSATEYITEMIDLVSTLLDKGFAYQTDLAIYFDVQKKDQYTKLSGQKLEDLQSGTGHGSVSDPHKKSPHDFSLWFFKSGTHENALQTWPNPFSETKGFPGWHIECSAMIKNLLGESIDVHMGGIEHIPVHHTNEIAQSESAHDGTTLSNYWLHNEHLLVDGAKMGKSAGNAYTLFDVEEKNFNPLDLRYFFLQTHYRSKQNFTWQALEAAQTARTRIVSKLSKMNDTGVVLPSWRDKFLSAVSDDFNVPAGLAVLHELFASKEKDEDKKATALDFDSVLGLDLGSEIVQERLELPMEITDLLSKRSSARADKNWELSDQIRDKIFDLGYIVSDLHNQQEITRK